MVGVSSCQPFFQGAVIGKSRQIQFVTEYFLIPHLAGRRFGLEIGQEGTGFDRSGGPGNFPVEIPYLPDHASQEGDFFQTLIGACLLHVRQNSIS